MTSKKHPVVLLFTLLLCGTAWLLPGTSQAATDEKTYPATSCRKMSGSTGTLGTRLNGTIENDHAVDPLTVICPIVRDSTQQTASWWVVVMVDDRSTFAKIECTAQSVGMFGGLNAFSTVNTGAVGITGRSSLTLTPPTQLVEGYSAIKCTLPAPDVGRSRLLAYTVTEPTSGDTTTDSKSYTGTYAELATATTGTFQFIQYPDLGLARPTAMAANDEWILPLIRDRHDKFWDRARFRFNDTDADKLVDCWVADMNEDGSVAGLVSVAAQGGVAPGQSTTQVNIVGGAGLNNGPLAMYCDSLASDVGATMYDFREIEGP